ncbi:hypothetical protein SSX86_022343 [Deinandra increscens subsp. villosa]|uniref:Uncharacterized protein n=1 Tax=Deinandra increscens subsp. villosa TaxID=3103831 RepID=A0AAP0GR17_9ASTR
MLDPGMELLPPLSSPTISSISSSDLDTESTGSFFHDRSTSLGTLMGVATTFRLPSRRLTASPALTLGSAPTAGNSERSRIRRRRSSNNNATDSDSVMERRRKRRRRRRWWWLCSGEDLKPSSLGEFLEVERRFGEEAVFGGEAVVSMPETDRNNGGTLFADGRVLPPPRTEVETQPPSSDVDEGTSSVCSLCRFSVSLAGICSGGGAG